MLNCICIYKNAGFFFNWNPDQIMLTLLLCRVLITRLHMLRELEEAVQRKFHVPSDVSDTTGVAYDWESRLHISQVWVTVCVQWFALNLTWLIFFSLPKPVKYKFKYVKHFLNHIFKHSGVFCSNIEVLFGNVLKYCLYICRCIVWMKTKTKQKMRK